MRVTIRFFEKSVNLQITFENLWKYSLGNYFYMLQGLQEVSWGIRFYFSFPLLFLESQIPWRIEIGRIYFRGNEISIFFPPQSPTSGREQGPPFWSGKFVDRKIHNLFSSLILWSLSIIASNRKQPNFERKTRRIHLDFSTIRGETEQLPFN